jgi:hypothetical protein
MLSEVCFIQTADTRPWGNGIKQRFLTKSKSAFPNIFASTYDFLTQRTNVLTSP